MTAGQAYYLRRELGGRLEGGETARAVARILVASVAARRSSRTSCGVGLDELLGRSLPAQVVSVGSGLAAGHRGLLRGGARAARARGRSRSATWSRARLRRSR